MERLCPNGEVWEAALREKHRLQLKQSCSFDLAFLELIIVFGALPRPQDALDAVEPGDTIELGDGDYWEDLKTRVSRSTYITY